MAFCSSAAVRLGDGNLSDTVGIQRRLITQHTMHPKYEIGRPYYDVAILTLDPPANITGQYVRPICLPETSSEDVDEFDGDQMDVAGIHGKYDTCHIISLNIITF